ncbi:TPA: hypothetical protein ACH3X2_005735 [Trebouxia sp. C0005]
METINSEIFTLTYGSIVRQLITDLEDLEEVNKQLDTMGYNIGIRLIDEFLAKSKTTKCVDFRDTADKIARVRTNASFVTGSQGLAMREAASLCCRLDSACSLVQVPACPAGMLTTLPATWCLRIILW